MCVCARRVCVSVTSVLVGGEGGGVVTSNFVIQFLRPAKQEGNNIRAREREGIEP